jgi:hypothetical protein
MIEYLHVQYLISTRDAKNIAWLTPMACISWRYLELHLSISMLRFVSYLPLPRDGISGRACPSGSVQRLATLE